MKNIPLSNHNIVEKIASYCSVEDLYCLKYNTRFHNQRQDHGQPSSSTDNIEVVEASLPSTMPDVLGVSDPLLQNFQGFIELAGGLPQSSYDNSIHDFL